jgi:UDP-N-acetylglucosamine enolpyruvyl transferase
VSGLNHLDRGYDAIEAKLTSCGAQLERFCSDEGAPL